MQKIIGAKKLGENGLNFFSCAIDVKVGDKVVVNVDDFQTIVTVTNVDEKISKPAEDFGKVLRITTDADLTKFKNLAEKAKKELPVFKKKSLELGLMMKFVAAEYSLDGSKILIIFSSEERVDFRQFLKELASMLKTRIELKQIGQRDEVKMLGGVGPCGQPCCCSRFLKDFEHVTVKMAKVQSLSLSPTKINGVCGRLMCCLGYESQMYEAQLAKMPKINSEVETPNGKGNVVYNDILRERVSVKRKADGDTIVIEEFELYEIKGFGQKPVEKIEVQREEKSKFVTENHTEKTSEKNFKSNNQNNDRFEKHNDKEKPQEMMLGENKSALKQDNAKQSDENGKDRVFNKNKKKFFNKNNKK